MSAARVHPRPYVARLPLLKDARRDRVVATLKTG